MNQTRLISLLISLLLIVSIFPSVNATITKEYIKDSYDLFYGYHEFSYKVKIIIETEDNDVWISGRTYDVTFTITLTYLNQSIFSPSATFVFRFYRGVYTDEVEVIRNSTEVSLGQTGSLYVRASETTDPKIQIKPELPCTIYEGNDVVGYDYWSSEEPIYINVQSPSTPSPYPPQLFYIVAGIILGAVVVGTIFIVKRRKEKFNPSKR